VGNPHGVRRRAELTSAKVAAYLAEVDPPPPAPPKDTAEVDEGRAVFTSDCVECHSGDRGSDGRAHDLGRGAADPDADLDQVVTPTLLGTRARTPYFHDGSAPTMDAALATEDHGSFP